MANKRSKDFDYFDHFLLCAQAAHEAALYLNTALNSFNVSKVPTQVKEIHTIENDADEKRHEMLRNLAHEFMTPIEREDIVSLAYDIDNVVDSIDDILQRLYMYNVQTIRPDALKMTALIVECTESLVACVKEFKNFRKSKTLVDHCIKVNTIESNGDKLYADCMRRLFTETGLADRQVLIWTSMFDCLENCLDACEDVAEIIEGVIMKNS